MAANLFRLYDAADALADGYCREWHSTIKHLVREQAGHRCIRCLHPYRCGENGNGEWTRCDEQCRHKGPMRFTDGVPLGENDLPIDAGPRGVEARWRILTVHHLDGKKLNCRWWNLCALCQRCHLEIQGRVKLHRPWLFDHSEWFRPYVAGYYAWILLGEELDRDATLARLDELLELGRTRVPPLDASR